MSIERFTDEDILNIADALNQRPRRILGQYHSPTELFDTFLTRFILLIMFLIYILFTSTCNLPFRINTTSTKKDTRMYMVTRDLKYVICHGLVYDMVGNAIDDIDLS